MNTTILTLICGAAVIPPLANAVTPVPEKVAGVVTRA